MFKKLLDGYGSFFGLSNDLSKVIIFSCSMLQPAAGAAGALGGLTVLMWQRLLGIKFDERIEMVNGILLGMLLGSLFSPSVPLFVFLLAGTLFVVLASSIIGDTLVRSYKLPLLGLPYAATSFLLLPACSVLLLLPASPHHSFNTNATGVLGQLLSCLKPLGAIYFNGTELGGVLIFIAFMLSSRYLALIALVSSILCSLFLKMLGFGTETELTLIAQMNCVLTTTVVGALFAAPGRKSFLVASGAGLVACTITISLARILWTLALPVLAVPFVLTTYTALLAFGSQRGGDWSHFWLASPCLPESAMESGAIARARGVDHRSISLKPPFTGEWNVYQGFGGEHTHSGCWHYSADFFQKDGERSFINDGTLLTDYLCYDAPVCSPVFGYVVDLRDSLPDNQPGQVDILNNWGNFILVRTDTGAYVMLAHLRQGSVMVALNSRVVPGQQIARCGNSGRSPQPHLHLHVQESAVIGSKTLPFHLTNVFVADDTERDTKVFALNVVPTLNKTFSAVQTNQALKQAMRLPVGAIYKFELADGNTDEVHVNLDSIGRFWLETVRSAKSSFVVTEDLFAVFDRNRKPDLLLDTIALALGLTPFAEGNIVWTDATPCRLLPLTGTQKLLVGLFRPWSICTTSRYSRVWDSHRHLWKQTGAHCLSVIPFLRWNYISEALLCETNGLLSVSLSRDSKVIVDAKLAAAGIRADNGIPKLQVITSVASR